MKIYLNEITEEEMELEFTEKEPWVAAAVQSVDEQTEDSMNHPEPRPIFTQFTLRKVDDVIVIGGQIRTSIQLICSRCAQLFHQSCEPKFSALFCKDPVMAGVAHLQITGSPSEKHPRGQGKTAKPAGQNQGFARHAHDSESDEATLQGQDLDITYLTQNYIQLSDVLTEQLQFQIPFQPLCKETCKGICSQCAVDLNFGTCTCDKSETQGDPKTPLPPSDHPFAKLSQFKSKSP
ncbi:MAG: YceD family protein [Bdellovibrionia bacterium]